MAGSEYWLWLSAQDRLSVRAKTALLRRFGDAETAFFASDAEIAETEGITSSEAASLKGRDLTVASEIRSLCEAQNLTFFILDDPRYPEKLKNIYAPPVVLYVRGSLPDLDANPAVAVVGTRSASAYGLKMSSRISAEIVSCGGIVLSGLTSGIDAAAAEGALKAGGICVGVLGTAHELSRSQLSREICRRGALISEYPPGTRTRKDFFRARNRITSGLSVAAVAVEAPEKSGTLLFVAEALEQGKDVFAVPGNADAEGCRGTNSLLKDGAKAATCGWDVIGEYAAMYPGIIRKKEAPVSSPSKTHSEPPHRRPAPAKKEIDKENSGEYSDLREQLSSLSEIQLRIVTAIEKEPTHVDLIVEKTGLSTSVVLTQLTLLTVKGIVRRMPGNRIVLNIRTIR